MTFRPVLGGTALFAVGVSFALHEWVAVRRERAAAQLSEALGVEVALGDAEVGLLGTMSLSGVRVADLLAADAIEGAVGASHLLAGAFVADEIRVVRPRLHARLQDGRIEALMQRAAARRRRPGVGGGAGRLRRIVVEGGELRLVIDGAGEIRARDVELSPQADGVRVVAGAAEADLARGALRVAARFARTGLDVALPSLRVTRAALDGGRVTVGDGLVIEDVVVVRGRETRVTGRLAGGQPIAVALDRDGATFEAEDVPLAPLAGFLPGWLGAAGQVGGRVHVARAASGGPIAVNAALRARGLSLRHPLVSSVPLPLSGALTADVSWDPAARAAEGRVRVELGRVAIEAVGSAALAADGTPARADVQARLSRAACAEALAALPAPLGAPLAGLDLGGELGGSVALAFDIEHPDEAHLDLDLDVGCRVLRDDSSAAVALLEGGYVHTLPDGSARTLAAGDPDFVPLARLPRWVPGAFIAAEDARFYEHHGFDEEQIRRSFGIDVAAGRVERGGSTISQQLVKNLFLSRERTLARKLLEAVLTWHLEQRISKKRILEAYLNVIELGDGVYGIEAAARRWFGKSARALTPPEVAFLAAITAGPMSATRRIAERPGRLDALTLHRTEVVLAAMRRASYVHSGELREMLADLPGLRLQP